MRISDWSSDVCSSDLSISSGARPTPARRSANSTKSMATRRRRMSAQMLPPQKQKQAADRDLAGRLAGGIAALLGPDWHRLHYGVAVSGGPDSMALLWLMTSLLPGQENGRAHVGTPVTNA